MKMTIGELHQKIGDIWSAIDDLPDSKLKDAGLTGELFQKVDKKLAEIHSDVWELLEAISPLLPDKE